MMRPERVALHDGRHGAAHEERALEVHVQVQVPHLLGELLHRRAGRHAGVVDQDVDAPERPHHGVDDLGDARRVAHVADVLLARPAAGDEVARDLVQQLPPHVGDHRGDALGRERGGDLPADTTARAGHDRDLASQIDLHRSLSLPAPARRSWRP